MLTCTKTQGVMQRRLEHRPSGTSCNRAGISLACRTPPKHARCSQATATTGSSGPTDGNRRQSAVLDGPSKLRLRAATAAAASQVLLSACLPLVASAGTFPDIGYGPVPGWTGPTFELSQDYPRQLPSPATNLPWQSIDFKTSPKEYMQAVLDYCYEGAEGVDFIAQKNTVRPWYHAPWMHTGQNARDFVRGLTNERQSQPYELSSVQSSRYKNSAIGFYNEWGGYSIGQVWADPDAPDPSKADFPEGTVTYKLLFSQAPVEDVPFLSGAPEWVADVNRASTPQGVEDTKVRLLQIDISVKDKRADEAGGWVMGTFQYDSSVDAASPWRRVVPVSLMWGNDPGLTPTLAANGARPQESWINPDAPVVKYRTTPPNNARAPKVMGWAGRANGPVDNPVSSCISCHSTAQVPARAAILPPDGATEAKRLEWFRNLRVGEAFSPKSQILDFSLQLGVGIQNFDAAKAPTTPPLRFALPESLFGKRAREKQVFGIVEQLLKDNDEGAR